MSLEVSRLSHLSLHIAPDGLCPDIASGKQKTKMFKLEFGKFVPLNTCRMQLSWWSVLCWRSMGMRHCLLCPGYLRQHLQRSEDMIRAAFSTSTTWMRVVKTPMARSGKWTKRAYCFLFKIKFEVSRFIPGNCLNPASVVPFRKEHLEACIHSTLCGRTDSPIDFDAPKLLLPDVDESDVPLGFTPIQLSTLRGPTVGPGRGLQESNFKVEVTVTVLRY